MGANKMNNEKDNKMNYKIIKGTCEDMKEIEDDSISCIFSSPPYALAKDYGDTEGIGMSSEFEAYDDYINRMIKVFKQCYRVLQDGRYIGINIADVIQQTKHSSHKKPIRFDFYRILDSIGFIYEEVIIWKKPEGMANQKRFGVFIQHPFPMYYHPNNIYEPILVFRKPGDWKSNAPKDYDEVMDYKKFQKYQSDVWEIRPETNVNHPAPFPVELPKTFFSLYSFPNETVLDTFLGSGSSMIAAHIIGRSCIGFEINPDYVKLIQSRSGQSTLDDFETFKIEIIER